MQPATSSHITTGCCVPGIPRKQHQLQTHADGWTDAPRRQPYTPVTSHCMGSKKLTLRGAVTQIENKVALPWFKYPLVLSALLMIRYLEWSLHCVQKILFSSVVEFCYFSDSAVIMVPPVSPHKNCLIFMITTETSMFLLWRHYCWAGVGERRSGGERSYFSLAKLVSVGHLA